MQQKAERTHLECFETPLVSPIYSCITSNLHCALCWRRTSKDMMPFVDFNSSWMIDLHLSARNTSDGRIRTPSSASIPVKPRLGSLGLFQPILILVFSTPSATLQASSLADRLTDSWRYILCFASEQVFLNHLISFPPDRRQNSYLSFASSLKDSRTRLPHNLSGALLIDDDLALLKNHV